MQDKIKGIIFDMDNTLLSSNINFAAMKRDIYSLFVAAGVLPDNFRTDDHTNSTMIETARLSPCFSSDLYEKTMDIAKRHELAGMMNACLEPGAEETVRKLSERYSLAVHTNNSFEAAYSALERNSITHCFEHIAGREQARLLKPSPAGVLYIMSFYDYMPTNWLSVGDSWLDGKSAQNAGVRFISYRGKQAEMTSRGVVPYKTIKHLGELLELL